MLCEGSQTLFELNTTAAFIWCCLEQDPDAQKAAADFSTSFKVSESEGLSHVQSCLTKWHAAGLIRGSEANRPVTSESAEQPQTATLAQAAAPAALEHDSSIFEDFKLVDSTFRISLPTSELRDLVYQSFANSHLPGVARHNILVRPHGDGVYVLNDGPAIIAGAAERNEVVPTLMGYLAQTALSESNFFIALHAAALRAGHGSFLLVGKAGSGKSTLTAALLHEGFGYYSDDVTLLAEPDLSVRPFPLGIAVKEGSWPALEERYPQLENEPVHFRWDKRDVRYLIPEPHQLAAAASGRNAVRTLFFVAYDAEKESTLEPIRKTEAVRRLLTNECYVPVRLTSAYVDRLMDWIQAIDAYLLTFANIDEAVELTQIGLKSA